MATLLFPPSALLILVGPSGSGKSTFATKHFPPTQVLSSDRCRAMIVDDASAQNVNEDAFALLNFWLELRLKRRRFTVVDSTAIKPSARKQLTDLAAKYHVPVYAVALDVPIDECIRRDAARTERQVGEAVIRKQYLTFEQAKKELLKEASLNGVHLLTPDEIETTEITLGLPPTGGKSFDIIGDVHGCWTELGDLFNALGYAFGTKDGLPRHPDGRLPVFVGDLTDRGPDSPAVMRCVADLVMRGLGLFVPGNHDDKLFRMLRGGKVSRTHGLDLTEQQLNALPETQRATLTTDVLTHLASTSSHLPLDNFNLVVAHAGIRQEMIGVDNPEVKAFTLYGDVRGFEPGTNRPIRHDWAQDYNGVALIVYGHTPSPVLNWVTDAETGRRFIDLPFVNNTINIDTGCVFGGGLTALRYPERELVSAPARAIYAEHENLPYSQDKNDAIIS